MKQRKISHWNNRVIKVVKPENKYEPVYYSIREVYYDTKNRPYLCTTDPIYPVGITLEELKKSYELMAEAFKSPTLDYSIFGVEKEKVGVSNKSIKALIPKKRRRKGKSG